MTLLKKILGIVVVVTFLLVQTALVQANSSDFTITSTLNIFLKNTTDDFVWVEDIIEIKGHNSSYYIPANSKQTVLIQKDDITAETLQVVNRQGKASNYQLTESEDHYELTIVHSENITPSSPFFAKITYQTKAYVQQNGNIIVLNLPKLHSDTVFEKIDSQHNLKTKYEYFLSYYVPLDAPTPSLIQPNSITSTTEQNYIRYTFSQQARKETSGMILLGKEQYNFFSVNYKIPKTDFITPEKLHKYNKLVAKNILELTLPTEFNESNQEVFFSKIEPKPSRIRTDSEGNVFAIFEVDANRNHSIQIEGYIKLALIDKEIPEMTFAQYKSEVKGLGSLGIYTQADRYWESESSQIKEIANQILTENENLTVLDVIRGNYNFVIDRLEYDKEKAEGENPRLGALNSLKTNLGVCMEYADLFIAIARAQGIPTRAAFGYGNDPLIPEIQRERKIGHQWVQIWYPNYGWLSVDPTWGETGREYIGADLEHLLWYTSADFSENITEAKIYSTDVSGINTSENHTVIIDPLHVSLVPDLTLLPTISDIILEYPDEEEPETQLEYTLKTTVFGRAIVFVTPVLVILVAITLLGMLISKLKKPKHTQTTYPPHKDPLHP